MHHIVIILAIFDLKKKRKKSVLGGEYGSFFFSFLAGEYRTFFSGLAGQYGTFFLFLSVG